MDTHVKEEERNNVEKKIVEKIIIDMQRNNKLLNAGGLTGRHRHNMYTAAGIRFCLVSAKCGDIHCLLLLSLLLLQ